MKVDSPLFPFFVASCSVDKFTSGIPPHYFWSPFFDSPQHVSTDSMLIPLQYAVLTSSQS